MLDVLGIEAIQAGRDLVTAGLVYLVYKFARDAAQSSGRLPAILKGAGFVLGLAAFAALMLGTSSCDGADPVFGYCDQSKGGDFAPTLAHRAGTFLYWSLLFGVPMLLGAMNARVDSLSPWRKPRKTLR